MPWLLWLHILLLFSVVWEARRCREKGEWQGENIYFQKTHKCKSHAAAKPAGESAAGRQDVRSCVTGSSLSSFPRILWFCVVQQDRHWGGTTSAVLSAWCWREKEPQKIQAEDASISGWGFIRGQRSHWFFSTYTVMTEQWQIFLFAITSVLLTSAVYFPAASRISYELMVCSSREEKKKIQ